MRPQRTPVKAPRRGGVTFFNNAPMDPVEVCARVRNLTDDSEEGCIRILNDKTLQLHSNSRVTECQFFHLFDEAVGQSQLFNCVAKPMVEGLVKGKSGLLFTYGVTSSGKTYTMTGTTLDPGFLPRCIDMVFNSICNVQASKYVFVPDGMNGFEVQSEADALLQKQEQDILPQLKTSKTPSKKQRNSADVFGNIDQCYSEDVNTECRYSVFVSYVEIYNDYIYDLLGDIQLDPFNRPKPPQSKRLREDRNKSMFVYGVTQIEVRTAEEAYLVFRQGQDRRRIAHTQLNAESSRSHSIFNIRLVQAPLDPLGEDLLQEKSLICVSQLSLVDLAGSERTCRTGAGGSRLREAGNINSSLMTLRRCLEQLRENQKTGNTEMVKYRNSKLTHLFKSYFEGHGKVKMVVCLNPNVQEYDENVHVVQFAEVAQQVEVARPEEYKIDRERIRRKALEMKQKEEEEKKKRFTATKQLNSEAASHRLFKKSKSQMSSASSSESDTDWEGIERDLKSFPNLEVADSMDVETLPILIAFLEDRVHAIRGIQKSSNELSTLFRGNLVNRLHSNGDLESKLLEAENDLEAKCRDVLRLEKQVKKLESKNQVLTRTTQVFEKDKRELQDQLNVAEVQFKNSQIEQHKMQTRLRGAVENTKAQLERECEKRVRNVQTEMQERMWVKDERLRQLKNIIADGKERNPPRTPNIRDRYPPRTPDMREGRPMTRQPLTPLSSTSSSSSNVSYHTRLGHKRRSRSAENLLSTKDRKPAKSIRDRSISENNLHQKKQKSPALDPLPPLAEKHRRSCTTNHGKWLAHYPTSTVHQETVLKPSIKPTRVVNVPSPKDVANASKYILTHQSEDKDGEIETQLVKGEVFRTTTGGQQVQFVDIETLKQSNPQKEKKTTEKKRRSTTSVDDLSSEEQSSWTDVETRCAFGIGSKNAVNPKRKK